MDTYAGKMGKGRSQKADINDFFLMQKKKIQIGRSKLQCENMQKMRKMQFQAKNLGINYVIGPPTVANATDFLQGR